MVSVSAIALSGFAASEKRISVAANNIANATTEGFRAQEVQQTSNAAGGVSTTVVEANKPAVNAAPRTPVEAANNNAPTPSNVNLEQELIQADVATYSAQANLKVIQVADKLNKYLLDIQA
jgi:flagellar basal body rod protein FlgG